MMGSLVRRANVMDWLRRVIHVHWQIERCDGCLGREKWDEPRVLYSNGLFIGEIRESIGLAVCLAMLPRSGLYNLGDISLHN